MEYDAKSRRRLGQAIRAARVTGGFKTREPFAQALGRSTRQVQALENGETGVGFDTFTAAARVLGWPLERITELLEGTTSVGGPTEDRDYVEAPGDRADPAEREDRVLRALDEMREDINALSRRVAGIESGTQPMGGADGQT